MTGATHPAMLQSSSAPASRESTRRLPATDAGRLRALCSVALRSALVADGSPAVTMEGVRPLLAEACREARDRGVHAEKLLVLLKSTWLELPDARNIPRHEHVDLLARVVTLCIDEYYRAQE